MDQKIIELYDDFTHRHLDRRLFIEQVTKLVGSSALAMTIMAALRSDYARAATDPRRRCAAHDVRTSRCRAAAAR